MALKNCPVCNTKLEYAGQPGDYGFDQRCPKCDVKKDCNEWISIKNEKDAARTKRPRKEILRSDEEKTCRKCLACALDLLMDEVSICPITEHEVFKNTPGCASHLPHVLPVQNCSNCKAGMKAPESPGVRFVYGCKSRVCFPSENQWKSYISCEKFDPKATVLRDVMIYYKKKVEMMEKMWR